jgi:septal ring factor EnvC (AmiA/AmiB activator)
VSTLARPEPPPEYALETLRARVSELEVTLDARRAEIAEARASLETFRIRYRQQVGLLHEELDDLEIKIAEVELGELNRRLDEAGRAPEESSAPASAEPVPRFTSDAVRRLFREVAKSIHPDLTSDEAARARRHALMIEANRAYALGDEEQLRSILVAWESSPEAVQGIDEDAMRQRFVRRIAHIEAALATLTREREELEATSLWQLKAMVDQAAAEGNDLVGDMVRRLKRDILVAKNRLDALTWSPR